jgi:hypothetical protein
MTKYIVAYRVDVEGNSIAYGITDTFANSTSRQGEEWANFYYEKPAEYEAGLARLVALVDSMNATYDELTALRGKTA